MKKIFLFCGFIGILLTQCKKEDGKNNTQTTFIEIPNISFSNQTVTSVAIDNSGNKWVGTNEGLYKYNNQKWFKDTALNIGNIYSLAINNGNLLIASSTGAYEIALQTNKTQIVSNFNKSINGVPFDTTNVFAIGMGNREWFGIPQGLACYDGFTWKENNTIQRNLLANDVRSIAFRKNDCFIGTYGSYLFHVKYDSQTDAITGASKLMGGADNPLLNFNGELTTDTIFCLFAGSDTSIWFGSTKGLTRNSGSTKVDNGSFDYYLRGERVHCVYEFSNGDIWAGTENGISVKAGSTWTNYTANNGLASNYIFCMAEDKDGSVWIVTQKGLSHYNGSFTNY
jgi:ligand-binding sensor domain-containing protein